jgi:AcrR family transcriptional regulator
MRAKKTEGSTMTPPQQARSRERVDLFLDTAAALFATVGYEAVTTNAIAERAGVSIGSLYRYFPDKQAILRALEQRRVQEVRALYDRVFNEDVIYLPLPVLIDRLVDPFLELHLQTPCYAHLLLASDGSADVAAATCPGEEEGIDRLAVLFRRVFPKLRTDRARLVAIVSRACVKTMISVARAKGSAKEGKQVIAEMKRMLLSYLEAIARE